MIGLKVLINLYMKTLYLQIAFWLSVLILQINPVVSQVSINEWLASNTTNLTDEFNEFEDWIELYNSGNETLDLIGYYLSDDPQNPLKFQITQSVIIVGEGYVLLWADKDTSQGPNHLDFKLSSSGESILLSDPSGSLIDEVSFGVQEPDISMGAFPNGSNTYFYFDFPTPDNVNQDNGESAALAAPIFSIENGFYNTGISLELSSNESGVTIFYTLDGSTPTASDFEYTAPISVNQTTTVRAIAQKNNVPSSAIASKIYFVNESFNLPTLSLIADPNDLFGSEGIYSNPFESGSDWERFCQVQYFESEELAFEVDCGIRIQGSSSVGRDKKSFRLFFESEYGEKWLEYDLFDDNPVDKFRNLVLRSGYDDDLQNSTGTLLRDPFCSQRYDDLGELTSDGKWAILTINGDYWGIYEIRESVNENFVESHTGWNDFDMIRFTKFGPELKEGTIDDWDVLTNFLLNTDLSTPANYAIADSLIDIENYINLLAFVNASAYTSWTWGVSTFKEKKEGSKWKFTVWDMDRCVFLNNWNAFAQMQNTSGIHWANFISQSLIRNEQFQKELLNRTADLLNTDFSVATSLNQLLSIKDEITPSVQAEIDRWLVDYSIADWEDELEKVNQFIENRPEDIYEHAVDSFNLSNTNQIEVDITGNGTIKLNSLDLDVFPWTGEYFESIPIEIQAIAAPGYYFDSWSDPSLGNNPIVEIDFSGTKELTANFILGSVSTEPLVINEINYNAADSIDSGDWIELFNPNSTAVNIAGWYVKDEGNGHYSIQNISLQSEEYLVIAENLSKFNSIYSGVSNVVGSFGKQGEFSFGLNNSGELIKINNAALTVIDSVDYNDNSPWPSAADGEGPSLQLVAPDLDNNLAGNWFAGAPTPGFSNALSGKSTQAIDFPTIADHFALDAPFELIASSSSELPISFALVSGPASLVNGFVHLDGISGLVTVVATQEGNVDFLSADSVFQTILIQKEFQSINFTPVGEQLPTTTTVMLDASATSGLPIDFNLLSGPGSIMGNVITLDGSLGSFLIKISQVGNDTYRGADDEFLNFEVDKLDQAITLDNIPDKFTLDPDFIIGGMSDSGLPLEYSIVNGPATIINNSIHLLGTAGMVTLRARQTGSDIYHSAVEAFESFIVNLTAQQIDFPAIQNKLDNDPPFAISASSNSNLNIEFDIISGPATIAGNLISLTGGIGNVVVEATQDGNSTWAEAMAIQRTFVVSQLPLLNQEITWDSIPDKYTFDNPFQVQANTDSELTLQYEIVEGPATIVGQEVSLIGTPGEVVLNAIQVGNEDYYPASKTISFEVIEVIPENQTIIFEPLENKLVNDLPFNINAESSSGLAVEFEIIAGTATVIGNEITLGGLSGLVSVQASQPGNNFFEAAEPVIQSFEVSLVSQSISFDAIENKFTNDLPFLVYAESSSGLEVSFSIQSGPATIVDNEITLDGTVGFVSVLANQNGNDVYAAASPEEQIFEVKMISGIHENSSLKDIVLFPNPAKDVIFLNGEESRLYQYFIYNQLGQLVQQSDRFMEYRDQVVRIGLTAINEGSYFLKLQDENGAFKTMRFLILR